MGIVEAPMNPNTICSAEECNNICVDEKSNRVIEIGKDGQINKARCCGVCSRWYCYKHKKIKMKKFINYSRLTESANYDYEVIYKCDPQHLAIERKHQS